MFPRAEYRIARLQARTQNGYDLVQVLMRMSSCYLIGGITSITSVRLVFFSEFAVDNDIRRNSSDCLRAYELGQSAMRMEPIA